MSSVSTTKPRPAATSTPSTKSTSAPKEAKKSQEAQSTQSTPASGKPAAPENKDRFQTDAAPKAVATDRAAASTPNAPAGAPALSKSEIAAQTLSTRPASGREGGSGSISLADVEKANTGPAQTADNPPNTAQAQATQKSLGEMKTKDAKVGEALATPGGQAVEKALVDGVEKPRSDGIAGQPGVLSKNQAERAAGAYAKLSPADKKNFDGLMAKAGTAPNGKPAAGADKQTEQALMLKALGAGRSVDDIKTFAEGDKTATPPTKGIRGQNAKELVAQTTPYDLDGTGKDQGLYQQYGNSCAPTVGMMLQHENDPIACRQYESASPEDRMSMRASEQANTLSKDNKSPLTREELAANNKRVDSLVDQVKGMHETEKKGGTPVLNADERATMYRYVNGEEYNSDLLSSAKKKIEAHKSELKPPLTDSSQLQDMRKVGKNMGMDSAKAYQQREDVTGVDYHRYNVPDSTIARDKAITSIERDLAAGKQVPIGVSDETGSGHAMLVQSQDPKKGFLVSDPMSGKTAWMSRNELRDGKFKEKFGLNPSKLSSYNVDTTPARQEVNKLFDGHGNLKASADEIRAAQRKNPDLMNNVTKDERSSIDSALHMADRKANEGDINKLQEAIRKKDDEGIRTVINNNPNVLKYMDSSDKGKALERLRGGYTSDGDAHAMQHIVRSCTSKAELRNVLNAAIEKKKNAPDPGQAEFHKYDQQLTAYHPYLIADLLNPDNRSLPEQANTASPGQDIVHYRE